MTGLFLLLGSVWLAVAATALCAWHLLCTRGREPWRRPFDGNSPPSTGAE